ncbi:MAG: sel1 repeat family protein [Verrucomicrobia bacterium]|nr:sel1 repeat family protein [Verrucomicrobiota bacterium]
MLHRLFAFLTTLLVLSSTSFSASADTTKPPKAEKPKTTAKTAAETAEDAAELVAAPSKSDLGAEKFWQALILLEDKNSTDLVKGRELLQTAADLEYPHAQTLLAECLMAGQYGFTKDQRKAANYYRLAAERGNAFAKVSLGQCFYSGTGVRKDRVKTAEWLTAALDEKADYSRPTPPPEYLDAMAKQAKNKADVAGELDRDPIGDCKASSHYLLGLIASTDKKKELAQSHFVEAANAGVDGRSGIYPAAVQAALNYAFGQGTPRNMSKANEMLDVSRKLTVRSGVRMIHNYVTLKVVDDFAMGDMEDSLTEAGEKFQTTTQFEIANVFTDKSSKDYNPAEAVKWYELSAESGNVWAMLKLALLYSDNSLGKPDLEKAFSWFSRTGEGKKPKHFLGVANLAICHFNGLGTSKDPEKANALFKKFKDDDFICYLGTIGQCPTAIVTWEQRLKLIETWAKSKKDPQAQYFMGERYLAGWDNKRDIDVAIRWLKKAAAAGHGGAWGVLGSLHQGVPGAFGENAWEGKKSALECFKKGSEAGNAAAMANYASLLPDKTPDGDFNVEVERLYIRSLEINPDNLQANNNLGVLYEQRALDSRNENAQRDKAKMFEYYEAATRQEFALAARNLAFIYINGRLADQDLRKAYRYLEQAAEWGMPEMHFTLGKIHEHGQGVPITYSEAAYHYRLAALEGHIPSLRCLIDLYVTGKTGAVDFDRAMFWLDRLVKSGDMNALTMIVDIMLQKKEYTSAIKLLRLLEENGNYSQVGFAYERLSRCYENGLGVKINKSKAKKYYESALENNNGDALCRLGMQQLAEGKTQEGVANFEQASQYSANACFYLGQLYFEGKHVENDRAKALKLIRDAASHNHSEALYFLAAAAFNKIPGAPSIEDAIRLATQAEVGGLEKAKALREKLEHRLNKGNETASEEAARARSS